MAAREIARDPGVLARKGRTWITENRNGFVVETTLTQADGTAERRAAIAMLDALDPGSQRRITLGADKGYDTAEFIAELRAMCVTPHIAASSCRISAIVVAAGHCRDIF